MCAKIVLVTILGLVTQTWAVVQESAVDYSGYMVLNVKIPDDDAITVVKGLEKGGKVVLWNEPTIMGGAVLVQVHSDFLFEIVATFEMAGLDYSVAIKDLQEAIDEEREANRPDPAYYAQRSVSTFNFAKYHPLNEIYDFLTDVSTEYPRLAQAITIGTTYEGRPIRGLRLSAAAAGTRPVIFMEFGIHAREWIAPATALHFIRELTVGYQNDTNVQKLMNTYEFYIIPSTNPDGYVFTHQMDRGWRKSRSRSTVSPNCFGADPNRNFDINFCGVGSSNYPCSDTYCGDYAFSESETRALRNITLSIGSRMKAYFGFHNYMQLWMFPYGYTYGLTPHHSQLNQISKIGTDALRAVNGVQFKYGPIATTIYQASGSSIDWIYDKVGCKMAFVLELRDKGLHGFLLPANQILPTAKETWAGIKAAIFALP